MNIKNVQFWTGDMDIEFPALNQIRNIADMPILAGHLAIMPDVHMGKGATVGSVIPTRNAIIPSAVGVDIGCGMCAVLTSLTAKDLPDSLSKIRSQIERDVPVGFNEHKSSPKDIINNHNIIKQFEDLLLKDKLKSVSLTKISNQIGTLGGGNHFIEICLDLEDRVWVMLHSGSRNIGNQIGTVAINMAKEAAAKRDYKLADKDLAWLDQGTVEFESYISAMMWAQDYAALNRDTMMRRIQYILQKEFPQIKFIGEVINCHHNFTSIEEHFGEKMWITRKGAVSARKGQMGIIPGSMGAKSFIVMGKGNPDSYCSCSHGAGRRMSRSEAKKVFTIKDLQEQTLGVDCRKDSGVIDEIPAAYKDIDQVMAAQQDLVDIIHTLKQVMCIKG